MTEDMGGATPNEPNQESESSTAEEPATAAPGPAASPTARRLERRTGDSYVAGVASGLAAFFGIDTQVVRLAFIVLTVLGGAGILLYLVAWAAIPAPGVSESFAERTLRRFRRWPVWVQVLVVVAALLIFSDGVGVPGPSAGLALGLIGLGFLMFRMDSRSQALGVSGAGGSVAVAGAPAGAVAVGGAPPSLAAPTAPVTDEPGAPAVLGPLTLAVALIAAGGAALMDSAGLLALTGQGLVALVVTVIGLGLIVGAWRGRSRGLIVAGAILVPVLLLTNLAPVALGDSVGARAYQPAAASDVAGDYELGVGYLRLDLSDTALGPQTLEINAGVGLGGLEVIVPDGAGVAVDGRLAAGDVDLFGERTSGEDLILATTLPAAPQPGAPAAGQVVVHVDSGLGEVAVRRASQSDAAPMDFDQFNPEGNR